MSSWLGQGDDKWWKVGLAVGGVVAAAALLTMGSKKDKKKEKVSPASTAAPAHSTPAPAQDTPRKSLSSMMDNASKQQDPSPPATPTPPQNEHSVTFEQQSQSQEPDVSRDVLLGVFGDILKGMERAIIELAQQEQRMKVDGVPPESIMADIAQAYVNAITQLQLQVFASHGVSEGAVDLAVENHQNDPEFKAITDRMQFLNRTLLGGPPELNQEELNKIPAWLTVDTLVEIFTMMMKGMETAFATSLLEVRKQHPNTPDLPDLAVAQENALQSKVARDQVLGQYSLTEEILNIALLKYANDAKLAQVMLALQNHHQMRRNQQRLEEKQRYLMQRS